MTSQHILHGLLVAGGGAIGSLLRYATIILMGSWLGSAFPYGTLAVNVAGSLIIGIIAGLGVFIWQWPESFRLFAMVGLLGGFTTFSAFSLDVLTLIERGEIVSAAGYIFLSVLMSLCAVFAGFTLIKVLS